MGTYGDCLVCANWARRSGCAIAVTQEVANRSRARGAELTEELAVVWCAAKRFDRAIALVENYIKENPEDPGGYQVLARIYERPDYFGKDRKRAVVLYGRFLELAQLQGGYTTLELKRARERMDNIQTGRASLRIDSGPFTLLPLADALDAFRAFYHRDKSDFFALGAVTRTHLLVARVGDVDPDSGLPASDVRGRFQPASWLLKRMRSASTRDTERDAARRELRRLATLTADELAKDKQVASAILLSEVDEVTYLPIEGGEEAGQGSFHAVTVRVVKETHEFLFPASAGLEAERCAVVLKRLTGK